ncbi:hypothetical protein EON81_25195 [bacterium]|nr:MAG: hypothetical protein EON81_25195 [bacterium]
MLKAYRKIFQTARDHDLKTLKTQKKDALASFLHHRELKATPFSDQFTNRAWAANVALAAIDEAVLNAIERDEMTEAGMVANLAHRGYEFIAASIVAECTGLYPLSEVSARTALEISVKLRYILSGDIRDRFAAYLKSYGNTVDAGLRQWVKKTEQMLPEEADYNLTGIQKMEEFNTWRRDAVTSTFGPTNEEWPKRVDEIFEKAGLGVLYRTVYWRLCHQTHGEAEDTIGYIFMQISKGLESDEWKVSAMETVVWTTWTAHIVLQSYLETCALFYEAYVGKRSETIELAKREINRDTSSYARWMAHPTAIPPHIGYA